MQRFKKKTSFSLQPAVRCQTNTCDVKLALILTTHVVFVGAFDDL
jgi:hypothetical protein